MAIAELVSTFEISPRLARPMKMMPSTASRIGAMLLAKKVTTPSVLIPLGSGAARVPCCRTVATCATNYVAIIGKPPGCPA